MNPETRRSLKSLFEHNSGLRICYLYPKDSEAALTFQNFRKEVASDWPQNICWKEVETNPRIADPEHETLHLLGSVFASPFIIEQRDGSLEVLLEVPARLIRARDSYDVSGYTSIFIELSDTHKNQLWRLWKPSLEKINWEYPAIDISVVDSCNATIVGVREDAYELKTSGEDEFDPLSFYVIATIEDRVVGAVRLTDSAKISPLHAWSGGQCQLPRGKGVVEMTRGVVIPTKRNLGIYKAMMLKAARTALERGFRTATAAIEEQYFLKDFLEQLGFKESGEPIVYHDAPRTGTRCHSIVCDLHESKNRWAPLSEVLRVKQATKRITVTTQ